MNMASEAKHQRSAILWVEDNPDVSLLQFIPEQVEKRNADLLIAQGVMQLRRILDEPDDVRRIKGIILDIMLYGASDLAVFGRENIKLGNGDETGIRLIENVFRDKNGEFKALAEVPILVLTTKPMVSQSDFEKYRKIQVEKKHDRTYDWESRVTSWIKERAK
uniref:Response regulatory domain-containing protein n=1 Tax=Candidatus Kentrum sp. MB TaxID=2138164 RepID=A0A450XQ83_9GAMM|nr:MAG: hypothetical protein BECKMB1821I_GA0114274_102410 [Candidatus Kentron sp. MB]VFK75534.1 MAG: hypothetical protein BECKMB1821H_GA0114242_10259 [Candidatus Kentron sp. MB]